MHYYSIDNKQYNCFGYNCSYNKEKSNTLSVSCFPEGQEAEQDKVPFPLATFSLTVGSKYRYNVIRQRIYNRLYSSYVYPFCNLQYSA